MKHLLCLTAGTLLSGCAAHAQANAPPAHDEVARVAEAALDKATDTIFAYSGFVWHTTGDEMSVQFGVPETDDRALRIDCQDGQLLIIAPASTNAAEGTPTTASFQNGHRRAGTISYLGDGPNFVVPVAPTDPVIETLMTEGRIRIDTPESVVSVSGAGGSALLRSLLGRCRAP